MEIKWKEIEKDYIDNHIVKHILGRRKAEKIGIKEKAFWKENFAKWNYDYDELANEYEMARPAAKEKTRLFNLYKHIARSIIEPECHVKYGIHVGTGSIKYSFNFENDDKITTCLHSIYDKEHPENRFKISSCFWRQDTDILLTKELLQDLSDDIFKKKIPDEEERKKVKKYFSNLEDWLNRTEHHSLPKYKLEYISLLKDYKKPGVETILSKFQYRFNDVDKTHQKNLSGIIPIKREELVDELNDPYASIEEKEEVLYLYLVYQCTVKKPELIDISEINNLSNYERNYINLINFILDDSNTAVNQ